MRFSLQKCPDESLTLMLIEMILKIATLWFSKSKSLNAQQTLEIKIKEYGFLHLRGLLIVK